MHVIHTPSEMHNWVYMLKKTGKRVGFVPTMGYLHKGHLELMKFARGHCDVLVLSIFVNPTQFAPGEDYGSYPRDLKRDLELAQWAGVDCLFLPEAADIYPAGYRTFVDVETLSEGLCGAFRPGHFRGVATVVAKLLNIVGPDEAFFGEKDAQQLVVIRRMVSDLQFPVKITGFPTVRESDGLAMSSRNVYLAADERERAVALSRALFHARDRICAGEVNVETVLEEMSAMLTGIDVEYVEVVDPESLERVSRLCGPVLIALAARVGKARLIDNITVDWSHPRPAESDEGSAAEGVPCL